MPSRLYFVCLAFLSTGLVDIGVVSMIKLAPRPLGASPSCAIEGAFAPVFCLVASKVRIVTLLEASEIMKLALGAEPLTLEDMLCHGASSLRIN